MDAGTIVGIALGIGLIFGSIMVGGDSVAFVDTKSLLLTMGGAVAGVLISYPLPQVIDVIRILRVIFIPTRRGQKVELVEFLVYLVEKSRREGLLALEDELEDMSDPFFKRGLELVIDGTPPELVRDILEKEIDSIIMRHRIGRGVFETLGTLAPAFGMIGTLVGLVRMLRSLKNPDAIGEGMALALLTTFYGAVAAYLIFIPVAGKLRVRSMEEVRMKEMIIEGLLSVLAGESPRYTREKLTSFLTAKERADLVWALKPAEEREEVEA